MTFRPTLGQYVAVTFINSYGNRGFIGALERYWGTASGGLLDVGAGIESVYVHKAVTLEASLRLR